MEYVELGLNTKMILQMLSGALARARALTLEPACVMTNRPFWRKWWPENKQQYSVFFLTLKEKKETIVSTVFCFQCETKTHLSTKNELMKVLRHLEPRRKSFPP